MSKNRRKRQIRNRIIAFVMAVAMVFTVVKVNSGKKVVKAGEGSTTGSYTDNAYLNIAPYYNNEGKPDSSNESYFQVENHSRNSGIELYNTCRGIYDNMDSGNEYTVPEYTIHTQDSSVKFKLPIIHDDQTAPCIGVLPVRRDSDYPHPFVLDNQYDFEVRGEFRFRWNNELNDGVTTLDSTDNKLVKLIAELGYDESIIYDNKALFINDTSFNEYINELNNKCEQFNGTTRGQTILILKYETATESGASVGADGSVEDLWSTTSTDSINKDFYYGHNEFVISEESLSRENLEKAASKAASAINEEDFPEDSTRYVYQRYVTDIDQDDTDEKDLVYFTDSTETQVDTNNNLETSLYYTTGIGSFDGVTVDSATLFTTNDQGSGTFTRSLDGLDFNKNTAILIAADENMGSVTVSGDGTSLVSNNDGLAIISVQGDDEGLTSRDVSIVIKNNAETITHRYEITLNYLDYTTFRLSDLSRSSLSSDDDVYYDLSDCTASSPFYINSNNLFVNTELSIGNGVKDDDDNLTVKLCKKVNNSETGEDEFVELSSFDLADAGEGDKPKIYTCRYSYDPDEGLDLEDGLNSLYIVATGERSDDNNVLQAVTGPFYVFYDTEAPTVGIVALKQDDSEINTATAVKDLKLEFTLTDAGAGLNASDYGYVEIINDNGTEIPDTFEILKPDSGDYYYAIIPAAVLQKEVYDFASGETLYYKIHAMDLVGNVTDPADATGVPFYDDAATEVALGLNFTPENIDGKDYYKNLTPGAKLKFRVVITSKVELSSIKIDGTEIDKNEFSTLDQFSVEEENDVFTYTFSVTKVDLATLTENTGGEYSITVSATNANGFISGAENKVFFVDIHNPEMSEIKGSLDTTGPATIESGSDTWYRDLFIILTVSDSEAYDSGLALDDTFSGSEEGVLEASGVTYIEDASHPSNGLLVYQVDQNGEGAETGTATVSFKVYDKLGNTSGEVAGTFNIDTEAPVISDIDDVIYTNTVVGGEIHPTITDNVKLEDTVYFVKLDDDDNEIASTKTSVPITDGSDVFSVKLVDILTSPITDGSYKIKVVAEDSVGNSSYKIFTVVLDITTPFIGFDVISDTQYNLTEQPKATGDFSTKDSYAYKGGSALGYDYYKAAGHKVRVKFTVEDENVNVDDISVKLTLDGTETDISNTLTWEGTTVKNAYLLCEDDGYYQFEMTATDTFNNSTTSTIDFTIDKTAPVPRIKLNGEVPTTDEVYYKDEVTVSYDYNPAEANPDEEDVYIKVDYTDTEGTANAGTFKEFNDEGTAKSFTAEGYYTVTIKATDMVSNESEEITQSFIIDKTAPLADISIASGLTAPENVTDPATNTYDNGRGTTSPDVYTYYKYTNSDVELTFKVEEKYIISAGDKCAITVKNGSNLIALDWVELVEGSGVYTATEKFSAEGVYNITIAAMDMAGNPAEVKDGTAEDGKTQTINFVIDKTAPEAELKLNNSEPKEIYTGEVTAKINVTEETNKNTADNKILYKYKAPTASSMPGTYSLYDSPLSSEGTYNIYAEVYDLAGNKNVIEKEENVPYTFIIDKTAPEVYASEVSGSNKGYGTKTINYNEEHFKNKKTTYYSYYKDNDKDEGVTVTFKVFDDYLPGNKPYGIKVYDKGDGAEEPTDITNKSTITKDEIAGEYTVVTPVLGDNKEHEVYVEVTDRANKKVRSESVVFIHDNKDPELTLKFDGVDAKGGLRKDDNVIVSYSKSDDNWDSKDVKLKYVYTPAGKTAEPEQTIEVDADGNEGFKSQVFPITELGQGDGRYTVWIIAIDSAGNKTVTNKASFVIDSKVPQLAVSKVEGTAPKQNKYPKTFTKSNYHGEKIEYEYAEVYGSDSVKVTIDVFDYDLNGNNKDAFKVYDNGEEITANFSQKDEDGYEYTATVTIKGEGKHHITATATDRFGNEGSTNGVSFTIDTTEPDFSLQINGDDAENKQRLNGKAELSYTYDDKNWDVTDVKLTGTFKPADGSAEVKISENLFDDEGNAIESRTFPKASNGEGEGVYTVRITAIDKAGNKTFKTTSFRIDTTKPEVYAKVVSEAPKKDRDDLKTTYEPAASNIHYTAKYDYGKYYNDDVKIKFSVFDYDLDTNTYSVIDYWEGYDDGQKIITPEFKPLSDGEDNSEYTATITIPKSEEGEHTLIASATDIAGNTSKSTEVTVIVDTTAPSLTSTINGEATPVMLRIGGNVNAGYKLSDKNNDLKDVKITYVFIPAGGAKQKAVTEELNYNGTKQFTENGTYVVKITAVDMAGNVSESSSSFVIDKTYPELDAQITSPAKAPKQDKFNRTYKPLIEGHFTEAQNGYKYCQYYNTDVKISFTAFDYDMSSCYAVDIYNGEEKQITEVIPVENLTENNFEFTFDVTIPVSEEGTHKIIAYAKDVTGHEQSSAPLEFVIDKTNPELSLFVNDKEPVDDQRIAGAATLSYSLKDTNRDLTDVMLTAIYEPADGSEKITNIEELYNNATRTFPNTELDEGDGKYTVSVTAIDGAGNAVTETTSFVIDTAVPQIDLKVLTAKPAKFDTFKKTYKPAVEDYFTTEKNGYEYGQYYKGDVKVRISVFDYDSENCYIYDNGEKLDTSFKYHGGGLYSTEITLSEEGKHVITTEAFDKAGNTGSGSDISFIIDNTAPTLTTTLDAETYSGTDAFKAKNAVVGIKVDDKNKDAADILREYVIAPSDGSAKITDSSYVEEGQETYKQDAYYTVKYTVVDRAGNSSTASLGFTIDKTKPQSDIRISTKAPAKIDKFNNKYSNTGGHFNTEYTYGQYYNESVSMDMAVFDYNVSKIVVTDNGNVIPVTFASNGDERVAAGITVSDEGEHVIKITVTDKSDNTEVSNTVGFIIDKTNPALSATLNGSGSITEQYLKTDASVFLSVSDTNEDENDVTRVVKMTRPSSSAVTTTENGALEGTIDFGTEADYEITYTAIDKAGNESSPVTLTFRVDKTAPQLSITGITRDATSADDVTITYGMVEDFYWDVTSATVKIYKKVDGMGETLVNTVDFKASGANSTLSEVFKEDGEYRFEFTAEDKTGNTADESFRFILDESAPIIILTGVDGYLTDEDVTFGVQVDEIFYLGNTVKIEGTHKTLSDPDGKAIDFGDYSRLTRTSSANFEQIFTEDGIYNIKITSKDVAGNETVQSVQFTIDKTKPLIKDLEKLANEEDYAAYVEATGNNDPDAKKLIPIFNSFEFDYEADDIVTDLTTVTYKLYMDGVLYDGLSDVADGFHELRVTAEDEVGNTAERSFYFFLDTVKPGIIVTGVEEGDNLQEATTITISLQLAEDTLKAVAMNGEAIAITNNTATIEVSKKGDYVLVIEAADDAGNQATMTIKFEYGKVGNWLWWLIAAGAALIIGGTTFFIILAKRRKKKQQ